jgi:hypothetical protein
MLRQKLGGNAIVLEGGRSFADLIPRNANDWRTLSMNSGWTPMKRALMSAVAVAFLLMLPELLAAQDLTSSIVGTWKLTSFARKELVTGKTAATYGEHPTGYAY